MALILSTNKEEDAYFSQKKGAFPELSFYRNTTLISHRYHSLKGKF